MQTTLITSVTFDGVGLHSGKPARMILRPAPVNHGIVFRRTDVTQGDARIPARWDRVNQSPLCTLLENADGVSVSTVEHIMAALTGCGVHNVLVEIDGPEVPILDGSASEFVLRILNHGLRKQDAPVRAIEVLAPVEVRRGDAWARLEPAAALTIDFHIDFADRAIGVQHKVLNMANGSFVRELCDSRTFCRKADVDAMRSNGLALGGTLENAVVVDGDRVLSPGGLRHADEAVRHKMLDALGDLALAGAPLFAAYTGHRAGHALTNDLLRALFARRDAWRMVTCDAAMAARLPGAGVHLGELRHVA
ncbi:UDP-3-O-[3-hydroxymyristoyl] N-acetylglucosamine deacetylase [Lutimaribacter pacificus]|uniref:UDP-3-O-acyl-N-acetylglucosamine deacetylase n=1 Tax=Lutimaribacter pacificus TaxID=391948 RepID=A0A1H0JLA5_9RHOB|nr:UDP-3-O-acyl-N-acetylglucosamine deacetylase [Lutimaribacter pacificus]SDO44263.1 UDP-3-O-[3-hydroxymyristoyl] N-acetylglucosamine deacetylase [Lutimaribacter pacificus]SHK09065.1 UDP-3-O-[3-hydroxymyristoyl] N-acetylglucosamine deacetylase [Lutimaribacter pacificus]